MPNTFTKAAVEAKQSFTSTMNYYSRMADHDNAWILMNNESTWKLGGTDTNIDDEETASISSANQSILRSLWFVAPFAMTVTDISGYFMDDDMTSHLSAPNNYFGIWTVSSFGTAGNTPTARTGSQTFVLKYITTGVYSSTGYDNAWVWHNSSPSLSLSAGDGVWVGTYIPRSGTSDDATMSITLCAEKD